MATLYLHIGTEKTGTTAIQKFCEENQDALARQGICYPIFKERYTAVMRCRNAHFMVMHEDMPDGSRRSPEATERWKRHMDQVEALLREHDAVLLTDEIIWEVSKGSCRNILPALKHEAEVRGFQVKIIIYLRRQDQYLASYWTQMVSNANKRWGELEWEEALATFIRERRYDYYEHLEHIAALFGRENIDVRVYERQRFPNGDIVLDFLNALGLRTDVEYRRAAGDVNTSISPGMREIKRTLNVLLRDEKQGEALIVKALRDCSQFDPSKSVQPFTEEQRAQLLELCEESDRKIARDYLGDENKPLFTPPEKLKEQQPPSEYERWENTVRFFTKLIMVQQQEFEEKLYLRKKLRYVGRRLRGWLAGGGIFRKR